MMEAELPVRVTVPCPIGNDQRNRLTGRLAGGLRALADEYGLATVPAVVIEDADPLPSNAPTPGIPVRLHVDGREVRQSPGALLRVVSAMPRSPLRERTLRRSFGSPADSNLAAVSTDDWPATAELLAVDLTLATFRRRPQLLATEAVAAAWQAKRRIGLGWRPSWQAAGVLRALLAAGLGTDLDESAQDALALAATGPADPEEAALWVLSQVRTEPQLVLRIPPAMAAHLGVQDFPPRMPIDDDRVPAEMRGSWSACASEFAARTGLLMPTLHLESSPELANTTVAVRIRRRRLEPIPIPGPGECWRAAHSSDADTLVYVSAQVVGAIGPASSGEGIEPTALLPQLVMEEILLAPELVLDIEQVAFRLAQIDDIYPDLVDLAMARLSIPALTMLLRQLIAERVYPRDLVSVLDGVASASMISAGYPGMVALDTRPLIIGPAESEATWRPFLEPVRRALLDQLPVSGPIVSMPPPIEEGLGSASIAEEFWRFIRRATVEELTVVAEDLARAQVTEEVAGGDPAIPVLSRYEAALHPALHIAAMPQVPDDLA